MANEKLDLIDRGALGIGKAKREVFENPAYADGWNSAIEIIKNAPTVDAVVVPCRVGDTLYVISQMRDKRILPFINEYECTSIKLGKRKCCVYHEMDGFIKIFKEDDFGKTVFLTKEEAEAALSKMDGGDGDG